MKQVLNEQLTSSLFEEVTDNKPAGILKRIKGIVADFKPNRNGRVYPRELWEKVINSEYVKEMMESKCLFGENNHPFDDRVEIDLNNVSHCIHNMWIEGDSVIAELDLLPTPAGEIINKLIEYGSSIGVSSRGAGSVTSDGNVDPDDYQFFTFDLVPRPSVAAARPTMIESEQVDKDAKVLTEGEIASILSNYRKIDNKIEESKEAELEKSYKYIVEGEKKSISTNIISKLIKESENL
jgi:hypothetical protein